jgi:putative methyltransferase (TIGR04325 family)
MRVTGIAARLPYPVARRLVPLLPSRAQRFHPASSWDAAARMTHGYEASRHEVAPPRSAPPADAASLSSRDVQLIACMGAAMGLAVPESTMRVVDLGGYHGGHRDVVVRAFPESTFDWTVVELPDVVRACSGATSPGLHFTSDLDEALGEGVDICLASASLNYVPDPRSTLAAMARRSRAVVLLRLPLWPITQHRPAIQRLSRHSAEVGYPTWFFSETQFRAEVAALGRIVLSIDVPEDRAYFSGHYGCYRGLVIAAGVPGA